VQASIDKLAEAFNQYRVESAQDRGATGEQLRHIQESVKELNGLFEKVAKLETQVAVLETAARERDKTLSEWRDESIKDRTTLHSTDERQNRMLYIGLGILATVEVVLTLLAPAIQAALHLP
jgi:TolA-binding protein